MLKQNTKTRVKPVSQKKQEKIAQEMNGAHTKVGFPKEASPASGEQKTMAGVARIAFYLNAGITTNSGVKSWTFMADTYSEEKMKIKRLLNHEYKRVVNGQTTTKIALGNIGEYLTKKTVLKVQNTTSPALEPSTVKAKHGDPKPLIHHGQMVQSITHVEVV